MGTIKIIGEVKMVNKFECFECGQISTSVELMNHFNDQNDGMEYRDLKSSDFHKGKSLDLEVICPKCECSMGIIESDIIK